MDVVVGKTMLGDEREAELSAWLVADGAIVRAGQPIAELEMAKVKVEIAAPADGKVQILVRAGQLIEPDAVIARIA